MTLSIKNSTHGASQLSEPVFSTNDVARLMNVNPRNLRRWLRNHPVYRSVGSGKRYEFTRSDVKDIMKHYQVRRSRG